MRRAGPRSHSEEVKESGLSASNTSALSAGHRSPSIPTATPRVSTSRPLEQVYSHRERAPTTQAHESEVSPQPGAGNAGSPCCHGNRWHSQHRLQASHLLQLQSRIMSFHFRSWHKVLLLSRQKMYPETEGGHSQAGQVTRKEKCSSQCKKDLFVVLFCFFRGHGQYPCTPPSGLEPHWPLFSHIS